MAEQKCEADSQKGNKLGVEYFFSALCPFVSGAATKGWDLSWTDSQYSFFILFPHPLYNPSLQLSIFYLSNHSLTSYLYHFPIYFLFALPDT